MTDWLSSPSPPDPQTRSDTELIVHRLQHGAAQVAMVTGDAALTVSRERAEPIVTAERPLLQRPTAQQRLRLERRADA